MENVITKRTFMGKGGIIELVFVDCTLCLKLVTISTIAVFFFCSFHLLNKEGKKGSVLYSECSERM